MFDVKFGIEHTENQDFIKRRSVRSVVKRDGKYLMIRTGRGDVIFPGGGIEQNESNELAVIRELREETGYQACSSPELIGRVRTLRLDRFTDNTVYESEMFFYQMTVHPDQNDLLLSTNELALSLTPMWLTKEEIIKMNNEYDSKLKQGDVWVEAVRYVLDRT